MQATNKSAETDARIAVRNAGAELYKERYRRCRRVECYNKAAEAVHTDAIIRPWPIALGQRAIRSRAAILYGLCNFAVHQCPAVCAGILYYRKRDC